MKISKHILFIFTALIFSESSHADERVLLAVISTDDSQYSEERIYANLNLQNAIDSFDVERPSGRIQNFSIEELSKPSGQVIRRSFGFAVAKLRFVESQHFFSGGFLSIAIRWSSLIKNHWRGNKFEVRHDDEMNWRLFFESKPVQKIEIRFHGENLPQEILIR